MKTSFDKNKIHDLISRQLENLFTLNREEKSHLYSLMPTVMADVICCVQQINNKYYLSGKFDPFHSGQYAFFLHSIARAAGQTGYQGLADRIYFLNKTLNGIDLYHEVEMPAVVFFDHPVGTVLGRAEYRGRLIVSQQVALFHICRKDLERWATEAAPRR